MSICQMRKTKALGSSLKVGNCAMSPYRLGWKVCVSFYQIGNMNEGLGNMGQKGERGVAADFPHIYAVMPLLAELGWREVVGWTWKAMTHCVTLVLG